MGSGVHGGNRRRVLLFVTLRRRDLLPMDRLASRLEASGCEVRLSGISDFLFAVLSFRPHVIVFGRCDHDFAHWLRAITDCVVFSLNTEQGGHSEEAVLNQFVWGQADSGPPALEAVDCHLLVDETTKAYLASHIDPKKLLVVGYTRLIEPEPASSPKPVSGSLVVGFAAGEAPRSLKRLYEHFNIGLDRTDADPNHEQGHLAYNVLEWMWINRLVERMKERYKCVVRIRQADTNFLLSDTGVVIDHSDDPRAFFEAVDVVVYGRSTIGVEALMAGVPALSISRLVEPLVESYRAPHISYVSLSWQPTSTAQLLELIDRRGRSELSLTPDDHAYLEFVTRTYYSDNLPDRSAERIAEAVVATEGRGEADLDLGRLFDSGVPLSRLLRVALLVAKRLAPRTVHRLVLGYLRFRQRFSRDSYLKAGVFIP